MCGIAGYVDKSNRYKTDKTLVKKMTDALAHRGPDAEGQWADDYVALGAQKIINYRSGCKKQSADAQP